MAWVADSKPAPPYSAVPAMNYQGQAYAVPTMQPMTMQHTGMVSAPMAMHHQGFVQQPMMPMMAPSGNDYQAQLFSQCANGSHQFKVEYGVCGIVTAVVLFPIGLVALLVDKKKICTRCGFLTE